MIKHSQITQSSKFAITLQHLKKEVRNEFSTSWYYPFWWKWPNVQNTENRKFVIFLQYIKKKLLQLLCVLLWCKTFRYFTGVQSCSLLLVLYGISNYHYKQYREMAYAICDFRIYYETLNCALKKAFIIKWGFFQGTCF